MKEVELVKPGLMVVGLAGAAAPFLGKAGRGSWPFIICPQNISLAGLGRPGLPGAGWPGQLALYNLSSEYFPGGTWPAWPSWGKLAGAAGPL